MPKEYCDQCCDFVTVDDFGEMQCRICNPAFLEDEEEELQELDFND